MLSSVNQYKPTGYINVFKLPLTILLVVPLWIISFIYAGLLIWNPITFLNPLIFAVFALVVGQIISLGINIADIQNKGVGKGIGMLLFLVALYFSWANFLAIWGGNYPVLMLQPDQMWSGIQKLYIEGAYSTFSIQINGYFGAILWIVEGLLLGYWSFNIAANTVEHDIYCNNCKKWIGPIEKFFTFQFSNEDDLIRLFKNGDLTFLEQIHESKDDLTPSYQIDASCCNTCANSYYLSLIKTSKEKDEANPEIIYESTDLLAEHINVSQANFIKLYAKSHHWFHYTESGRFKHSLWLGIPILGILIHVLGWLYQSLSIYMENYFITAISLIFISVVLVFSTKLILETFESRNSVVSDYFGLMIGAMAVYLTNMAIFAGTGTSFFWHPDLIWMGVSELIQRHEWEGLAWFGLILETGILFLAPVIGVTMVTTGRVYCEKCNEWAHEEDDLMDFSYENEIELKEKFRSQSLDFLDNLLPVPDSPDEISLYKINAEWCKKCNTVHTLSLEKVKRTYDSRDRDYNYSTTSIYEDLIYTHEAFDTVMAFAKKWKERTIEEVKEA